MTPEEQNAVNVQQKANNYLQRKLWAYRQWKQNVDTQYANHNAAQMEVDTMNLYESWLQATDEQTKQKYNVASRGNLLAEMIVSAGKDKWYNITWNTSDIIGTYLQWFPSDSKAFYDFTHWDQDPEDFAIQMWWMEKPWLLKRTIWAIGWSIKGLTRDWVSKALKRAYNNLWDIQDIATDENKNWLIKAIQILGWEVILDTIWGGLWDIIWWWIEWAFKWATTEWERRKMENSIASLVKMWLETETWQDVLEWWDWLDPETQKDISDVWTYLEWAINLGWLWLGAIAKKWATSTVNAWTQSIKSALKEAWEQGLKTVKNAKNTIATQVEKQATKSAIKNVAKNEAELSKIANIVWQWTTKDIPNTTNALKILSKHTDLKSLNGWQELDNAWYSVERKIAQEVDENLAKYAWKIKASDQKIIKVDWKDEWRYVEEAIDDLLDVYRQERDYDWVNKVLDFQKRFMDEGVSYKELNDFAREYWTTLNAWNAKNQITTNAKQWWEKTRAWIKDLIRERVPDSEFANLDAEIGSIANFRKLTAKTIEWVNNTEKRLRERWITETLRKKYSDIKNFIMWAERSETENLYHIEERLPQLLERFDKLNNDIAKANSKQQIENLINSADWEIRVWLTSVKWYEEQPFDSLVNYASMLEQEWDLAWAKEVLDYTLKNSEKDIRETLWDSIMSIEKTIWRYGSNEPTFFLKVNNDSPATIWKIADLAKKYKQNSFFTAKKVSNSTPYWPVAWKPWTAIEPWVIIKTEKAIDNMNDFDTILKDAWFEGATLLPWWKGIELYNLSQFWWTPESTVEWIKKLMNNKQLIDKYWIADINDWKFEVMHIWMEQSWRPGWAWNQQWLWTYNELSKYLKSLSNK